jgi:hypothetical protein
MKLGIEKTAVIRVRAGISYALTEAMDEGHCGLPTDELVPLAEKLLEVPQQLIRTALELELTDGTVIADRVGNAILRILAGHQTPAVRADGASCHVRHFASQKSNEPFTTVKSVTDLPIGP